MDFLNWMGSEKPLNWYCVWACNKKLDAFKRHETGSCF